MGIFTALRNRKGGCALQKCGGHIPTRKGQAELGPFASPKRFEAQSETEFSMGPRGGAYRFR